jgi:hypothetical protein
LRYQVAAGAVLIGMLLFSVSTAPAAAADAAPSTPTGLRASVSGDTVTLSWTPSTDDSGFVDYDVHVSSTASFTPDDETLWDVAIDPNYVDTPVAAGTWYYRIVAVDDVGNTSAPSGEVRVVVPDITPPSAPGTVAATVSGRSVTLTWSASGDDVGVTRYEVHKSSSATFDPTSSTLAGSTSGTSLTETSVPGGTWYYGVVAVDRAGNRSATAYAPAAVVQVPRAPGVATELTATPTDNGMVLRWSLADPGYPAVDGYTVTIRPGGLQLTTTSNFVEVSGLWTGATYAFTVYARNSAGIGRPATSAPFIGKGYAGTAAPGAPPLAVHGLRVTPGRQRAVLSWQASAEGDSGVLVQRIHRDASGVDKVVEIYRGTGTTATSTGQQEGTTYRFTISRLDAGSTHTPAEYTLYGSHLSRSRSAMRVVLGRGVTHRTRLTPVGAPMVGLGGKSVALYARKATSRSWTRACSVTTSASGTASCDTRPTRNTAYEWRFLGSAHQGSATSRRYTIGVRPRLTARVSASSVSRGASFTLAGSVAPRQAGERVYLQQFSRGAWRSVARSSLSSRSTYSFRVSPRATYSYRVYKRADRTLSAGISTTRRVTVR